MANNFSRVRSRHSIGEWYGQGLETLDPEERRLLAQREIKVDDLVGVDCPFQVKSKCNKKGGVCSLRLYKQEGETPTYGTGSPITTCPNRFLEDNMIYTWVGEVLLGTKNPEILSEIGFLDRLRLDEKEISEEESKDFIGRIDSVLLHPEKPLNWCALEIQAVYFSGKAMKGEFALLSKWNKQELPFPALHRRPDWRSSGPKRLLPQLQTKTPTISRWGKKIAVVVDEPFFSSLVGLKEENDLSNAEIVWFVVGYDPSKNGWKMAKRKVALTTLDSSVKALTGGTPLPKDTFEKQLLSKLRLQKPQHPLLK